MHEYGFCNDKPIDLDVYLCFICKLVLTGFIVQAFVMKDYRCLNILQFLFILNFILAARLHFVSSSYSKFISDKQINKVAIKILALAPSLSALFNANSSIHLFLHSFKSMNSETPSGLSVYRIKESTPLCSGVSPPPTAYLSFPWWNGDVHWYLSLIKKSVQFFFQSNKKSNLYHFLLSYCTSK